MYTGLCLSDPHPDHANDGYTKRTLAAARFAGRYRLVDFMLSNMVNSGIYTIGMILNSQYQSLIAHIGMGKEWDLARKSGGVTFFPPYLADERQSVNREIDGPLQRAAAHLAAIKEEYVVLVDSSVICNMDYRQAIRAHGETGADVTAIYAKKSVSKDDWENSVVFDIGEDRRIHGIRMANPAGSPSNVSLGAYIMQKKFFLQLIAGEKNCGMLRFSRELLTGALGRLKVMAYEFTGYSAQIFSLETFFKYNMEMLDNKKRHALFDYEGRRILTTRRDSLPTKYGKNAVVENSITADGCRIEGTVINSIICRGVRVRPGAVVKNCILKDRTTVEKGANLSWLITDRDVIISENRNMIGTDTFPVYIGPGRIV